MVPSLLKVLAPLSEPQLSESAAQQLLSAAGWSVSGPSVRERLDGWELEGRFRRSSSKDVDRAVKISSGKGSGLDDVLLTWFDVVEQEQRTATQAPWHLTIALTSADLPILDFHAQLQLAAALLPKAVAAVDVSACAGRSAGWLMDAAGAQTPLGPSSLFSLHALPGSVHTHGLRRFGIPEFELQGAQSPQTFAALEAWAGLFLDGRGVKAGEPLELGPGLRASWAEGEDAPRCPAATESFGVVLLPGALAAGQAFFHSKAEGVRAGLLAQERLGRFLALQRAHGKDSGWRFLAKAVMPTKSAAEHLWFSVGAVDRGGFEGELLNAPVGELALQRGQKASVSWDDVSDWRVESPRGQASPENVLRFPSEAP